MKVSLNEIRRLGYDNVVSLPINELADKIGSQLGAIEDIEDLGAKYQGVVVARVVSCEDHPNADRLHVCMVDDGGVVEGVERDKNGYVQVVCGAPNVHADMLVAWLPPSATVPETYHHEAPFVLDARELRGVISNGMLASPKELALSDDHTGILEIDVEAKPGDAFAKVYQLDDHIIDIENKMFTHRPDCFGLLGVARELAGIQQKSFKSPDWYLRPATIESGSILELTVENELPEIVPRFMAVALSDIHIAPSPAWLESALLRLGVRPINNVVDITNYVMLLTGQPLHAYDYDKVASKKLGVRAGVDGEKLALLNGKEISLTKDDVVITDGNKAIGLGGVMGGADTEVDESTQSIILECANFDMYAIRRTSMRHGLFTDAVTRFNKGQSIEQNDRIVLKALEMLHELAGGTVASKIIDQRPRKYVASKVIAGVDFINERLGLQLSAGEMAKLLQNVEFDVTEQGSDIVVTAPFWRTDIEIPEDIVEEVGRLYGYDRLPLVLPKRDITPATRNAMMDLKSNIRRALSRAGANEVLTYSFVHGNLLERALQDPNRSFQITNALSPDLQYYRQSVLPSLLASVHPNLKAGYDEFALFEIGKGHWTDHVDNEGLPLGIEMLDFVYAANDKLAGQGAAYYQARTYLQQLTHALGLQIELKPADQKFDDPVAKPFDLSRSAFVFVKDTDQILGVIGEIKSSVRKGLKLPIHTAAFNLSMDQLLDAVANAPASYRPLSRYPSTSQDICFRVSNDTSYAAVHEVFESVLRGISFEWKLDPIDIYQGDDRATKQITIRVTLNNPLATLKSDEVQNVVSSIVKAAADKLNAEYV